MSKTILRKNRQENLVKMLYWWCVSYLINRYTTFNVGKHLPLQLRQVALQEAISRQTFYQHQSLLHLKSLYHQHQWLQDQVQTGVSFFFRLQECNQRCWFLVLQGPHHQKIVLPSKTVCPKYMVRNSIGTAQWLRNTQWW